MQIAGYRKISNLEGGGVFAFIFSLFRSLIYLEISLNPKQRDG